MGASYINGAAYNPRVLIALMNIWRVHYNFFDWRPYRTPLEADASTAEGPATGAAEDGAGPAENGEQLRRLTVPGTDKVIFVPKRRANKVARTTPAMRMGVQQPSQPKDSGQEAETAEKVEGSLKPPRRSETADGTTVLTCPTSPGFSTNRGCSTARRCGQNFRVDDGLKRNTGDSFLPPVSYKSEWLRQNPGRFDNP
ncbi:hypothetical protein OCGS_0134 [Oceaniovalibus guishaninsula JLT2003]|uniref:Uncharacterized protein n=1 Tax=Oceaniovalibus guishaninsula JLT2003 TaxID=1231392 RepID=K2I9T0_9RHOB|nr:hypothetical protein OCGS_0134 [Oceaniovalibus guishaninsula JLT2003]